MVDLTDPSRRTNRCGGVRRTVVACGRQPPLFFMSESSDPDRPASQHKHTRARTRSSGPQSRYFAAMSRSQSPISSLRHLLGSAECGIPDATVLSRYAYIAPNELYRNLFSNAAKRDSDDGTAPNRCEAGWLVSDNGVECDPVFVAHSTLSAVWLLRETLPKASLSDASWEALARAARLPQQPEGTPPSTQRRRPSPPSPPPSTARTAKRARTNSPGDVQEDVDGLDDIESMISSLVELDAPLEPPPVLRQEVTHNNRRAQRRRGEKLKAQAKAEALKQKQSLGLIQPCESAPPIELAAYASILPDDETMVAWIIKQPVSSGWLLYEAADTPYSTAMAMLGKARALGNETALCHVISFLQSWRSCGTPFASAWAPAPSAARSGAGRTLARLNPPEGGGVGGVVDDAFRHAWDMVNVYEGKLTAVHVQYRWAMASLARAYMEGITALERRDDMAGKGKSRGRGGHGNLRSEAKKALLSLIFPHAGGKDYSIFNKRLQRATRWYQAAHALGWGCLCLMPPVFSISLFGLFARLFSRA